MVELYSNDYVPVCDSTLANFTGNVLAGGGPQTLTPGAWVGSFVECQWSFTYSIPTWNFAAYAGGATIYGYVIYDSTGAGTSLWSERFLTPFAVPAAGGSLTLQVTYTDKQC